jgi:diguanylate cyclase (GGDEF)-like protein
MALAYFDFDELSYSLAHDVAMEHVLMTMAEQMRSAFRATDVIGRVESRRFAVLLTDCTDEALNAVEGVRAVTSNSRSSLGISLTVGMVRMTTEATIEDLMGAADRRANAVKRDQAGLA